MRDQATVTQEHGYRLDKNGRSCSWLTSLYQQLTKSSYAPINTFFFLHVEYFKCVERRVQNSIGASDIIDKSKPTQTNELVRCNADHTGTSERLGPNITGVEPSGQCKAQNKHISWSITQVNQSTMNLTDPCLGAELFIKPAAKDSAAYLVSTPSFINLSVRYGKPTRNYSTDRHH